MRTTTKTKIEGTQVKTTAKKPATNAGTSFVFKSGPQLMKWRREKGISRVMFAEMAGLSERTLATVEKVSRLSKKIQRPMTETARLVQGLQGLAGDQTALKVWLQKPNPSFGHKTPFSLIKNGESDRLWEMVYQLRQGAFA